MPLKAKAAPRHNPESAPKTAFDSLQTASVRLGLSLALVKAAKAAGCPAFRSNRVYGRELLAWLNEHPMEEPESAPSANRPAPLKEQKIAEEVRKLKLRNDLTEGRLVSRAWVAERMQAAAGQLHAIRQRSERDDALQFSAACPGADVPRCRAILKAIWGRIFEEVAGLGEVFAENPTATPAPSSGKRAPRKVRSIRRARR